MALQCVARRPNERLQFGDGTHYFYTEERCTKKTDSRLCKKCTGSKNVEDHGTVTDPLPPLSHIYESTWYDLKCRVYGSPSKENMAKAKKAQDEARAAVIAAITGVTVEKKRTFKVAVTIPAPIEVSHAAPVASPVAAPIKAKRQPKKVVLQQTVQPLATESVEQPLQDLHCITISVRKIEHNGRKYYLNSDKDKLYAIMPDGGVGKYCGRLDRENDRIADFPDSDSER